MVPQTVWGWLFLSGMAFWVLCLGCWVYNKVDAIFLQRKRAAAIQKGTKIRDGEESWPDGFRACHELMDELWFEDGRLHSELRPQYMVVMEGLQICGGSHARTNDQSAVLDHSAD